jgi:cobalt-zinc-cadmium efflux system outer membrane protein
MLGVALVLGGCVARNAGYADVQRVTRERIGKEVRWRHVDSGGKTAELTRSLLSRPLSADSAVQLGLLNSARVQAAFADLGWARAELVRALAIPNPTAEVAVRFREGARADIELSAFEDLSSLLLLPLRKGAAAAALDAAKAETAGRILDEALGIRLAFYDYQAASQTFALRRTILQAAHAAYSAAERMHEAGNITDLSLANERALYEEARIELARAEANERALREQLNERMGLFAEGAAWTVEARLPDATPVAELGPELERRALEKSLDLQAARQRYAAAARRSNYGRARGVIPLLRAGVSAERAEDSSFAVGPAAVVSVPLFYQGQGEVDAASAEMQRERQLYDAEALRIRTTARALTAKLEALAGSAQYYQRVLLPLRDEIVQSTELEYNAMSVGIFQLLQAKREQIRAAETYVDLLRDYWSRRAEAEQLAAGRLPSASKVVGPIAVQPASSNEPSSAGH